MATRKRARTQSERRGETLGRLRAATISVLHDRGFSRTSTTEIARIAGVSRGALTHHFASKEELLVDAIAWMLEQVNEKLFAFARDYAERGGSTDEIVDYIWGFMSDRLFYVTMEYLPETRHNPDFRAPLLPVVKRFHDGLDAIWSALARRRGASEAHARIVMNASMCLVRGMIAQTILRDDPPYYAQILEFWKAEVRRQFPSAAPRRKRAS